MRVLYCIFVITFDAGHLILAYMLLRTSLFGFFHAARKKETGLTTGEVLCRGR